MLKALNEKFIEIAPTCFFFEKSKSKSVEEMAKAVKSFYFPYEIIDVRSFDNLNHLISDGVIGNGVHRFVNFVSKFTDVYYYKFSFVGRHSTFKYPRDKPYGVHHGDDIQYLFNAAYVGPRIEKEDPENFAVERMTRIWEAFAATGLDNFIRSFML